MSYAHLQGSELWEYDFDHLVKEYVVGVWNVCKQKLYSDNSCPSQLFSLWMRICSWVGDKQMVSYVPQVGKEQMVRICLHVYVYVHVCMCGSSHKIPPMIVGVG